MKIKLIEKKTLVKVFFKLIFIFLRHFSMVFCRFLCEFPIFLETVKFPLNATEYYLNNSMLSVENIKLMAIFEAKMGQNGRR